MKHEDMVESLADRDMVSDGLAQRTIDSIEFDEIRRSIWVDNPLTSRQEKREILNYEDLRETLIEQHLHEQQANMRIDDGSPGYRIDLENAVDRILQELGVYSEFWSAEEPVIDGELLLESSTNVTPAGGREFAVELEEVSNELLTYLARKPEDLRIINPRKFEEVLAEIFKNQGYEVELTPPSRDGGRDLMLVQKASIGSILTLVECKRYSETNKVGVGVVRSLYGVVESERATNGLVATTSYFTKGAVDFRERNKYRMDLANYSKLCDWLRPYGPSI